MEDRYDISVDVGDGKDWWYVHGLATHDKVYELNRQMCDIGKTTSDPFEPISEEASQDITKVLERMRNPKSIMEEKKTKKMTKAEAFEYLKGKRVACDGLNNEDVQRKLFEVGIRWRGGKKDVTAAAPFLFINPDGITHCGSLAWFNLHEYEEISADDILSIEIVEDGFSYEKVVELAKPLMAYLNEVGCEDGIRVSQYSIVHEPMSTLVFDMRYENRL